MYRIAKASAFTLVEFLIVIAIISILAGMLFPVFARSREKARQRTCASNEKQISLAFLQYAQDNDGILPSGNNAIHGDPVYEQGWAASIYPYVKSIGVFACPDDPTIPQATPTAVPSWSQNGNVAANVPYDVISYVLNDAFSCATGFGSRLIPNPVPAGTYLKESTWNCPAVTVLLMEGTGDECQITNPQEDQSPSTLGLGGGNNFKGWNPPGETYYEETGILGLNINGMPQPLSEEGAPAAADGWHTGGSNFLFCDGHVKWLRGTSVSPGAAAQSPTGKESGNIAPWEAAGTSTIHSGNSGSEVATFSPI